ncbi:nickel ABC transporter, nickel/metallophore periplasmic binding protein [Priestia megaterium]|nr:nickel ABC transporter, nickel/metallophore periplasmic binding protein [Priestia megaterium]
MLLVGCSAASNSEINKNDHDTITISWPRDIGELDPQGYSPNEMFAQNMVYESLVQYKNDGTISPQLAKSWTISNDGKEYIFKLRDDVKFSDGSKFNAQIVKKNFDRVLNEKQEHNWLDLINQIDSTTAVDEYTVKITLKNAYYPLLQELTLVRPLRFLGESGFPREDDGKIEKPVGTGPWVLKEYKKNEKAVFERNKYYWGDQPKSKQIIVKIIPDSESRVIAFENNEIDLIYGNGLISLDSYEYLRHSSRFKTDQSEPMGTRTIALNTNRGPTKEVKVRQALIHAFNTERVVKELFHNTEVKADALFAPNSPYSDIELEPYKHDIEKAKKLLDEAGWVKENNTEIRQKNGTPLKVELIFDASDQIQKAVGELLQGELREIGIDIVLKGEEQQTYIESQKHGEFNLTFSNTWGAPYDPHSLVSSMRIPTHADYEAQKGLPMKKELDQKISDVLVTTDEKSRQELYKEIMTTLHEEAVYLPISYTTNVAIYQKDITGVEFSPVEYEFSLETVEHK